MFSSSQVKGTELPLQHPSSCCRLIFGLVVSDMNPGVEDLPAKIIRMKRFVCFDDSGRQRGKSLTRMWSLNRTLISVPNTLLFFSCFCFYLFFCFFFTVFEKKTSPGISR